MSLSKYSKRRGQFEALEAKQLFAADLVGGAAADLPDTVVVAGNISEDDFVINPLNVRTNLGGQEGEPLMNTNLGDHLVVDGEGLYQRNELELASSLGGQEGEPVVAPVSDMVFENLGGQDALIVMLEPDHQAVAPF